MDMDQDNIETDDGFTLPRVQCTRLGSVLDLNDPDFWNASCPSPMTERLRSASARSKSLPGSATLGLPPLPPSGSARIALSPRTGSQRSISSETTKGGHKEHEIRILVLGYTGVGKSALVVRFLTKRFIGDYAPYATVSAAQTTINNKRTDISILDLSWQGHPADDVDTCLDWCHGAMLVSSLIDSTSIIELQKLCRQHQPKLKRIPTVLVGTKSDLTHARQVTHQELQQLSTDLKCPYVETSARESLASSEHAFASLVHEISSTRKKKPKRNNAKNGYSSKLQNIKERLRSIAGEFRQRTNTF